MIATESGIFFFPEESQSSSWQVAHGVFHWFRCMSTNTESRLKTGRDCIVR